MQIQRFEEFLQTTTATDAYVRNHAEALALLAEITEVVEDLPAPDFEGFTPHWGHVGDLELLISRLRVARDGSRG
jgi:hypothetical protein